MKRLIAGALGVGAPKILERPRAYERAVKEKELRHVDESSSRPASRLSAQKKDKMGSAQVSKVFSVARQTSWSVHSYSRSSSPRARGSV